MFLLYKVHCMRTDGETDRQTERRVDGAWHLYSIHTWTGDKFIRDEPFVIGWWTDAGECDVVDSDRRIIVKHHQMTDTDCTTLTKCHQAGGLPTDPEPRASQAVSQAVVGRIWHVRAVFSVYTIVSTTTDLTFGTSCSYHDNKTRAPSNCSTLCQFRTEFKDRINVKHKTTVRVNWRDIQSKASHMNVCLSAVNNNA